MQRVRSLLTKGSRTSFQILSDLHLEIGQQYASFTITPVAPYLVLAGDIGRLIDYDNFLSFLEIQVKQFKAVFLALGNHEFYGNTFEAGLASARKLEQDPRLKGKLMLLHQKRYDIPGAAVTVLGCTLWSSVPESSAEVVRGRVKDFQKIQDWTVEAHNNVHTSDLFWLKSQVAAAQVENRTILVITHHAPAIAGTSDPQFNNSPWNCAFATDVLDTGNWDQVHTWVYGHTHYTTQLRKNGVKIVSNQRGYVLPGSSGEREKKSGFDVSKKISL